MPKLSEQEIRNRIDAVIPAKVAQWRGRPENAGGQGAIDKLTARGWYDKGSLIQAHQEALAAGDELGAEIVELAGGVPYDERGRALGAP